MASDLESVIKNLPGDRREVLEALKILVDVGLLAAIAHANSNQLVDGRMDSHDETAIAEEVREARQINRILLGLEESAKQLTKGMDDE